MIRLEFERRKKDLTQKMLGEILKMPAADICRIENGSKPYNGHLKRLSDYFNVSGEDLLKDM